MTCVMHYICICYIPNSAIRYLKFLKYENWEIWIRNYELKIKKLH